MNFWNFCLLILLGLGFVSCDDTTTPSSYPSIEQYLERNNITEYDSTASGLIYIVIKEGTGEYPKLNSSVTVHYTGYHLNDNKFDSSYDRNEAFTFFIGDDRIIAGWNEGVPKFNKGGEGTLLIPWELAYGENGRPDGSIGPKEDLRFDISVLAID